MITPKEIEARIDLLNRSFAVERQITTYERIRRVHDDLLQARGAVRPGVSAPCMFVMGAAGSGKSTALQAYARKHPIEEVDVEHGQVTRRRVLSVEVPAMLSVKALIAALIQSIDREQPQTQAPATQLTERFLRLAEATGVELVLLDEAHRLGHYDSRERISDWIVQLLNRNRFGIVVAGLKGVENVFIADDQLSRRVVSTVALEPYDWRKPHDRKEFKALVDAFLHILGLEAPSVGVSDDRMLQIYNWTGGLVGHLRSLIAGVGPAALRSGTNKITREMLATWADEHRPVSEDLWENPFQVPRLDPVVPGKGFASVVRKPPSR
jgi:DNA transposition AAA+ family ATPase